ncbi:hypothetical protein PCANC_22888 [Puccinia coronata f. sp. avenae]|uniref:Uncharacterized protein n=1 Tax=Puccinia coronata f. sp. avenae TaxID=200324 RepID=A0A2N5U0J0_9BASI|nr:hypothetical protein PCANC_22888 [Puccinia coronata f. sp. avenae]
MALAQIRKSCLLPLIFMMGLHIALATMGPYRIDEVPAEAFQLGFQSPLDGKEEDMQESTSNVRDMELGQSSGSNGVESDIDAPDVHDQESRHTEMVIGHESSVSDNGMMDNINASDFQRKSGDN